MSALRLLLALALFAPTLAVAGEVPPGLEGLLEEAGATLADLERPSDAGLQDGRWRLASVDGLLASPLTLPGWVQERATRLERDLPAMGGLPGWDGFFGLAVEELGAGRWTDPCVAQSLAELGLVDHHVAWEAERGNRMSRREVKALREGLSSALDARLGRLVSAGDRARCRLDAALEPLDPEAREAVVAAVATLLDGVPPGTAEAQEVVAALEGAWGAIDGAGLLEAGRAWTAAVDAAALELAAVPEIDWPGGPAIYSTRHGELWIGSFGHNSGTGDPFVLVDPGGDDVWRVVPDAEELPKAGARAVRGWIDLGGDDLWQGGAASVGGALLSISAGIDAEGDDTWRLGDLSGGAAAFGVATWLDGKGGDLRSVGVGGQGFATFGAAAVRDRGEQGDGWQAVDLAQGVGLPVGFGLLHDEAGDDRFVLAGRQLPAPPHDDWTMTGGQGLSLGLDPLIGGGLGWLMDGAGDDVQEAPRQAQAGCSGRGVAVLWERGGDDLTRVADRGQAAAGVRCVAALFDSGGDDSRVGGERVQAWAWSGAVAWLRDGAGDDRYAAVTRAQGASGSAIALLEDAAGVDVFVGDPGSQGSGLRQGRALSVLLDRGEPGGRVTLETSPEPSTRPLSSRGAASPEQAPGYLQEGASGAVPAHQVVSELTLGGVDALAALVPTLSEARPAEVEVVHRAMLELAHRAASAEDAAALARLLVDDALARERTVDEATVRWHLAWLRHLVTRHPVAVTEDVFRAADELSDHPAWPVRMASLQVWGAVALTGLVIDPTDLQAWEARAAIALQNEDRPELRRVAIDDLSVFGGAGVATVLVDALVREPWHGRAAAERALGYVIERTDGLAVARALFPIAAGEQEVGLPVREAALRLLGSTGHREAWDVLEPALVEGEPRIRLAAAVGSKRLGGRTVERALAARLEVEADPAVREALAEAGE